MIVWAHHQPEVLTKLAKFAGPRGPDKSTLNSLFKIDTQLHLCYPNTFGQRPIWKCLNNSFCPGNNIIPWQMVTPDMQIGGELGQAFADALLWDPLSVAGNYPGNQMVFETLDLLTQWLNRSRAFSTAGYAANSPSAVSNFSSISEFDSRHTIHPMNQTY